ncbi:conserved Plasmodium protein, unknown function [Plasmodium chabaudi chabaudi]|uniref:COPI associated protein n=1 Tax=Plasmodium chabaudi chabaudi TaxID=31271 RepID=A0A077TMN0_PLACU|nr:conserved protein, unknown function [Plasmodium chabaudi chabaudi]SCN61861.1 conserved Plasmodium protein, unknown function [Plasmodium chabaudi chabaudi]VTZ69577.1 conserved protein, unknown function [Plasmodium chabaudi chabaudi]|eukprot:XP_737699.1 conserved Plasmodium protein, unknown function [Plasmodium chabaudi chabaudi]
MPRIGELSNCCCLPLGGACIFSAVIILIRFLGFFLENDDTMKTINIVLYAILFGCILMGLLLKNFIILYIVTALMVIYVVDMIIAFVLILLRALSPDSPYTSTNIVFVLFTIFTSMIVMLLFLNIFLSMANVLKEGGTGWENKNYKQIRAEKEEIMNREEKKIIDSQIAQNDYKA